MTYQPESNDWKVLLFRRIDGDIERKIHLTISNVDGRIVKIMSVRTSDSFLRNFLKYWREIIIVALSTFLAGKLTGFFDRIFRS